MCDETLEKRLGRNKFLQPMEAGYPILQFSNYGLVSTCYRALTSSTDSPTNAPAASSTKPSSHGSTSTQTTQDPRSRPNEPTEPFAPLLGVYTATERDGGGTALPDDAAADHKPSTLLRTALKGQCSSNAPWVELTIPRSNRPPLLDGPTIVVTSHDPNDPHDAVASLNEA
jgi:hypothetical protein